MDIYKALYDYNNFALDDISPAKVETAIAKENLTHDDLRALLSPQALPYLEDMAVKASELTRRHFGYAMLLYTPLYLANYCENKCVYCGFNCSNAISRTKLTLDEVEAEARAISAQGFSHIIILTGESQSATPVSYIADCTRVLSKYFHSISLEVYPMEENDYRAIIQAGADSLTVYQEVYDEAQYRRLHLSGPKADYHYRLKTPETGCKAGFHAVNIGALLGLGEWRAEGYYTALHAQYLMRNYPEVDISVSFPRMQPHEGGYPPPYPVNDTALVQLMLATRLFLPNVGITISTREKASFRDNILPLGVTKLSAGSVTEVGGHAVSREGTGQFDIADERSAAEVCESLRSKGFWPVFRDYVRV